MPASASPSSERPTVTAPDGIAIHTFAVPEGVLVGVAEGRIPPGRYGIHRHLTLEQYTYVVTGELIAVTGNAEDPSGRETHLRPGDLLLTSPGESIQFVNDGGETARVLFICGPPYPADDADTRVLDAHGPPSPEDRHAALQRLEELRARLNAEIDGRIAALERTLGRE